MNSTPEYARPLFVIFRITGCFLGCHYYLLPPLYWLVIAPTYIKAMVLSTYHGVYGSTPYVGMAPKKIGGHIKSAQMTRSKCLH